MDPVQNNNLINCNAPDWLVDNVCDLFTLCLQTPAAQVPLRTDTSCTGVEQFIRIQLHFWTHLPISHTGDLLSAYVSLPPSLLEGRSVSKLMGDEVCHSGICLKTPLWTANSFFCMIFFYLFGLQRRHSAEKKNRLSGCKQRRRATQFYHKVLSYSEFEVRVNPAGQLSQSACFSAFLLMILTNKKGIYTMVL